MENAIQVKYILPLSRICSRFVNEHICSRFVNEQMSPTVSPIRGLSSITVVSVVFPVCTDQGIYVLRLILGLGMASRRSWLPYHSISWVKRLSDVRLWKIQFTVAHWREVGIFCCPKPRVWTKPTFNKVQNPTTTSLHSRGKWTHRHWAKSNTAGAWPKCIVVSRIFGICFVTWLKHLEDCHGGGSSTPCPIRRAHKTTRETRYSLEKAVLRFLILWLLQEHQSPSLRIILAMGATGSYIIPLCSNALQTWIKFSSIC